jgi:hypothetical protein
MSVGTHLRGALWYLALLVTALFLTVLHIGATIAYVPLGRLSAFTAFEPFQHRLLIPALAAVGQRIVPGVEPLTVYFALEVVSWIAFFLLARAALAAFVPGLTRGARQLLAFTAAWPVLWHLAKPQSVELVRGDGSLCRVEALDLNFAHINLAPNLYYPYDLPSAVFTLLVVLLAVRCRERWGIGIALLYLAAVAAAALNRESAVLLVLAAGVLLPRRPQARYWTMLALHTALALGVAWLARRLVLPTAQPNPYGSLGGGSYEFNLVNNLRSVLHPFFLIWGIPLFAGGLWLPLLVFRRYLARDLRRTVLVFVLPSFALALILGHVLEGRVFVEIQPILWIATLQAVAAAVATRTGQPPCPGNR